MGWIEAKEVTLKDGRHCTLRIAEVDGKIVGSSTSTTTYAVESNMSAHWQYQSSKTSADSVSAGT